MRTIAVCSILVLLASSLEPPPQAQRRRQPAADPFDDVAAISIGEGISDTLHSIVSGVAAVRRSARELSVQISAARDAFWAQHPKGPRLVAAESEFARRLTEKDITIVSMYIMNSERASGGCASAQANMIGDLLGITAIDGGIPTMAWLPFCRWVDAIRRNIKTFSDLATWGLTALQLPEYESYRKGRDYAESHRAGKFRYATWADFLESRQPEVYVLGMVWGGINSDRLSTMSFPEGIAFTQEYVDYLTERHGRDRVFGAVRRLMEAPKLVVDPDPARAKFVANRQQLADMASVGCRQPRIRDCFLAWVAEWEAAAPRTAPATPAETGRGTSASPAPPAASGKKPTGPSLASLEKSANPDDYVMFLALSHHIRRGPTLPEETTREQARLDVAGWTKRHGSEFLRRVASTIKQAPRTGAGDLPDDVAEWLGCYGFMRDEVATPGSCFFTIMFETYDRKLASTSLPRKIRHVDPVYDKAEAARSKDMLGFVVIEVTVAPSGEVMNARVTRSLPPFDQAALDAVRQWRYEENANLRVPIKGSVRLMFRP
jgi:TonB family protein